MNTDPVWGSRLCPQPGTMRGPVCSLSTLAEAERTVPAAGPRRAAALGFVPHRASWLVIVTYVPQIWVSGFSHFCEAFVSYLGT